MKALLHDQDIRDEVSAELIAKYEKIISDKDVEIAKKNAEIVRYKKLLR